MVANSKKVGRHFQRQTKPFFLYIVIVLEIRLGKRSLMCYKVDMRMDDIQCSSAPKSKMASSYWSRCMSCILEMNLTWNLLWIIFPNRFNSLYHLVRLWWNILVANLVTNFQDLVAKVKNLVALAPVLSAISCPVHVLMCNALNNEFLVFSCWKILCSR